MLLLNAIFPVDLGQQVGWGQQLHRVPRVARAGVSGTTDGSPSPNQQEPVPDAAERDVTQRPGVTAPPERGQKSPPQHKPYFPNLCPCLKVLGKSHSTAIGKGPQI